MKNKKIRWLVSFSVLFLLIGCGMGDMGKDTEEAVDSPEEEVLENKDPETEETKEISQVLTNWLPQLNDVRYTYEGTGNEYASFTWSPQFNQENKYQVAKDNGGTTVVEIYEYREDAIVRIFSRPETYFRDNFADIGTIDQYSDNEILLKKPLALGTSWTTEGADYEITAIDKEISVPAGDYTTLEVTAQYEDAIIKRYYAEQVGLVYEWTETSGLEIESALAAVEKNVAAVIPLTIYQADDQLLGLDRIPVTIELATNEPARLALQTLFTGEASEFANIYLLPEGTEINYLFLNKDGIVEVDLSKEYIDNMNVGSSGESFYLTGLTNTLTQYYGVEEVLLTIEGENYKGGHIILRDDETLSYDDSMVNEE